MLPTYDPDVFIEEERVGYVRYHRVSDGRRWEVWGVCDYRGDCIVGAVDPPLGPREGRLDVPVTPEFSGCCEFRFVELENADNLLPS
mgnify:CR=1 FL=1